MACALGDSARSVCFSFSFFFSLHSLPTTCCAHMLCTKIYHTAKHKPVPPTGLAMSGGAHEHGRAHSVRPWTHAFSTAMRALQYGHARRSTAGR